jgi:hypothetical protein
MKKRIGVLALCIVALAVLAVLATAKVNPLNSVGNKGSETSDPSHFSSRQYNFVSEKNIKAYQCKLGPYPMSYPDYFDAQICNVEFSDITSDGRLDRADRNAVGGISYANYAVHHFFVFENVSEGTRKFDVKYVTYNGQYNGFEHHFLYVKNFDKNQWELLSTARVGRLHQGSMKFVGKNGNQSAYVQNGEMWFMGTEGMYEWDSIGSDTFSATVYY